MALTGVAGLEGEGDENVMAEHEEHPNANAQPEKRGERSEASRTPDEASRRAFIRKTAEGAALSLFGVMGLDAVVEKVVQRLEDVPATRALARATGELLHDAGIGRMAFAAEGCNCPPEMPGAPNFTCAWDQNYTCPQNFSCPDNMGFQCNPFRFECAAPNWVCTGEFSCTEGYLCPGQGLYAPDCNPQVVSCGLESFDCDPAPGIQYTCTPAQQFDCQTSHRFNLLCTDGPVSCPDNPFACGAAWWFECGTTLQATSRFRCDEGRFACNAGTLYDFRCRWVFNCGGGTTGFHCNANHLFSCGWNPDHGHFVCAAPDFTCAAGGNRCNLPGTGVYNAGSDVRPGDFLCWGAAQNLMFRCESSGQAPGNFTCLAVDDFECMGAPGGVNFVCQDPQHFQCPTPNTTGGVFRCDADAGQYNCPGQYQLPPP